MVNLFVGICDELIDMNDDENGYVLIDYSAKFSRSERHGRLSSEVSITSYSIQTKATFFSKMSLGLKTVQEPNHHWLKV